MFVSVRVGCGEFGRKGGRSEGKGSVVEEWGFEVRGGRLLGLAGFVWGLDRGG